jgi:peroxiredoxin
MAKIRTGHQAPPFELGTATGERLSLASVLAHGPAVVVFFKISCPTCQFALPFIQRLYEAYGDGAGFLGVSQDDAADTEEFRQEHGITFPALLDEEGYPASNDYGLTNVPTYYLIGPDGTVRVDSVGFGKKALEQISKELAEYLGRPLSPVFFPEEIVPESKPG